MRIYLFALVTLLPWLVSASDLGPRIKLPKVETRTVRGDDGFSCVDCKVLTGELWGTVAALAKQNKTAIEIVEQHEKTINDMDQEIATYKAEVRALELEVSLLNSDRDYLRARIKAGDEAFLKLQKGRTAELVAWKVAAAVELVAILVLGGLMVYQSSTGNVLVLQGGN